MIKVALIGAGKMGISHLSILGAHPDVNVVGVCDKSELVTNFLTKVSGYNCFSDYIEMIEKVNPDAVFVAIPTKTHYEVISFLLKNNIHVFAEKPFTLLANQSSELANIAQKKGLINQVGYHNKFIGTFNELKKIVDHRLIGNIYHFVGEAYGPVITRKRTGNWRAKPEEGGGCLLDYASHVIDLINYILSPIVKVHSAHLPSIFSDKVEDAVYAMVEVVAGIKGQLSVNWSDDAYRKMTTSLTISGTKGKVIADTTELKVYFKDNPNFEMYTKGWNILPISLLQQSVDFYLRGEEYSTQIDYFVNSVKTKKAGIINSFASAAETDYAISMIRNKSLN